MCQYYNEDANYSLNYLGKFNVSYNLKYTKDYYPCENETEGKENCI